MIRKDFFVFTSGAHFTLGIERVRERDTIPRVKAPEVDTDIFFFTPTNRLEVD